MPVPTYKMGRELIAKMSPAELVIALARHGIDEAKLDTLKGRTTCPHCGHNGPVVRDFGVRILAGVVKPQSWCRECRADPTHAHKHTSKRFYKTKGRK